MSAAAAPAHSRLYRFLARRWWLTLILMGLCFVMFGLASVNLVQMLAANLSFLSNHGLDAVREGGVLQLLELLVSGLTAAGFYVLFKLCESILVHLLAHEKRVDQPAPTEAEGTKTS